MKKKYGAGLMFSNLMNIGKKKVSSLESQEKSVDTSGKQKSTSLYMSFSVQMSLLFVVFARWYLYWQVRSI